MNTFFRTDVFAKWLSGLKDMAEGPESLCGYGRLRQATSVIANR